MERNIAKKINCSLLLGTFLTSLLFYVLLISSLLFAVGTPIGWWNLCAAVVCSTVTCFFAAQKDTKKTLLMVIAGILILAGTIYASHYVFDRSYDGNTYHKSMVGLMKDGWNPLRVSFYDYADSSDYVFLQAANDTWYDAYPKMSEIWGACVYTITHSIEDGKNYNLVATISAFFVAFGLLCESKVLKKWQAAMCAVVFAFNPVILHQMFTYYNDGFIWAMVSVCMAALLYMTFFEEGSYKNLCTYLVFISINIGFNIKFSGILFFAILCFGIFVYWIIHCLKSDRSIEEKKKYITSRFLMFAGSVLSGTVVTGATSYVMNTIRYRNPVYTMIGEGSTEIIAAQLPQVYKEMGNIQRFICSLFSRTNNNKNIASVGWKFPFTFDEEEFFAAQGVDVRTAGWGILFSGIFLVSLVVLIIALVREKDRHPKLIHIGNLFIAMMVVSIVFVPGMSWARYNVAMFYIPAAALGYLFMISNQPEKCNWAPLLAGGLLALSLVNMAPNVEQIKDDFKAYDGIHGQFMKLKGKSVHTDLAVGCEEGTHFYGRFFTLYDYGIDNFTYETVTKEESNGMLYPSNSLLYQFAEGVCSTDNLIDFMSEVDKLDDWLLLIAVKDEASEALSPEIIEKMRSFGLAFDLEDAYRHAYLAVLDNHGVIYEHMEDNMITFDKQIEQYQISLKSAGYQTGNVASIKINGKEYSLNKRGINIVLLDKNSGLATDQISVDTYADNTLYR